MPSMFYIVRAIFALLPYRGSWRNFGAVEETAIRVLNIKLESMKDHRLVPSTDYFLSCLKITSKISLWWAEMNYLWERYERFCSHRFRDRE